MYVIEHAREDGEDLRLGTVTELATELDVGRNQVSMWAIRHERNGFPAPVSHLKARNGMIAAHYDIDEVVAWRATYLPSGGGWPAHRIRREAAG